ncbi:MAG: hypothetical protein NTW21_31410 [Verrucomicrobia bacterium]|nr:hypothetical protein [Verrucomicrobiota bacterium]
MTVGTVKTVALHAAVCCAAALAAWTVKQALPQRWHTPPPTRALPPPTPSDRSEPPALSLNSRVALAEALADADAARLRKIATGLLARECRDIRVWRTVLQCWVTVAPQDAWTFAKRHADAQISPGDPFASPPEPNSLREATMAQWGKVDPRAARAALGGPAALEFMALVAAAMEADVEYGFLLLAEALPAGHALPEGRLDRTKDDLVANLARRNPTLALEWAQRLAPGELLAPVLVGWIGNDPAASRTWLDQQAQRAEILEQAAEFMADDGHRYQPQMFDLILASLPPGNAKAQAVQRILDQLARVDPELAIKEVERTLTDAGARAEALATIAGHVLGGDPARAWAILSRLDPSACGIPRAELPATELIVDGETRRLAPPSDFRRDLTNVTAPGELKAQLLDDMIWTDKEQALRCLAQCPPENLATIGGRVLRIWAAHDPEEAAAWLAPKLGDHATTADIGNWFERSNLTPQEMRALAEALPPGGFRAAFAAWTAGELVAADPSAALDFARAADGSPAALTEVYQAWAEADPAAAMRHLAADPQAPPAAWTTLVETACHRFPNEIADLVAALPSGPARDAGLAALVVNEAPAATPVTSVGWACGIEDEATRSATLESILDRVSLDLRLVRDGASAQSLRETVQAANAMPDSEKQRWLQRIDRELAPP